MQNIATGAIAAIAISMFSSAFAWSFKDHVPLLDFALLLVVAGGLLLQQRRKGITRSEAHEGSSWQATEEQHAIPRELLAVPGIRVARYGLMAALLIGVLLYPFVFSSGLTNLGGTIALHTMVALSLVVLTGWAGQVSLGQFGFVAIGAVVGGALTSKVGVPFWFAVPIAAAVTGVFAVLIGLPALRIRGLFLGVTTFAFAVAVPTMLFAPKYFSWLLPTSVDRPTLFLLDFDDERSMFYLCVLCLVVSIWLIRNLRQTRWGRLLIGLRDNEPVILASGISVVRTKLMAFALSGALAGFAGAVFAHHQRGVSLGSFAANASIDVFLLAVIGGVSSVNGALLGAAYFNATRYFVSEGVLALILGPGFTLGVLYLAPGGLISLVTRLRDEVLRIVAQRRQMVVPSLFADFDPAAAALHVAPLAEVQSNAGIAALGGHVDYSLKSELYPSEHRVADFSSGPSTAPTPPTNGATAVPIAVEAAGL
jgi:branched-chain amino acid transport system permease protein